MASAQFLKVFPKIIKSDNFSNKFWKIFAMGNDGIPFTVCNLIEIKHKILMSKNCGINHHDCEKRFGS